MKKLLAFWAAGLLFCVVTLQAQNHFGFRAGLHYADVQVPSLENNLNFNPRSINGIELAGFYEVDLGEHFSLRPELSYKKKGFSIQEGLDFEVANFPLPVGVEAITQVKYIEMPVLGKYAFGEGPARAYLMAGPSVGYALDARLKTRVNSIIDFNISNTKIDLNQDTYERVDLAGVAGAGVELNMGGSSLFFEARYAHSFSNLLNDPVIDLKLRNKGFGLSAGYKFAF